MTKQTLKYHTQSDGDNKIESDDDLKHTELKEEEINDRSKFINIMKNKKKN